MRLAALQLKNFRNLQGLDLAFTGPQTVIVGPGGSGKTAVLDAISAALDAGFGGGTSTLRPTDHRLAWVGPAGARAMARQGELDLRATVYAGGVPSEVGLVVRSNGSARVLRGPSAGSGGPLAASGLVRAQDALVVAFGASRLEPEAASAAPFETRVGSAALRDCLRAKRPGDEAAVAVAVQALAPGLLRLFLTDQGLMAEQLGGAILPFEVLSAGIRSLAGVAAELAARCLDLHPGQGPRALSLAVGLVLIDDLELHLHGSAHHEVLERLRRTFPGLQFVVTTHSPLVVAQVRPEDLVILGLDGPLPEWRRPKTAGRDANALWAEVFGVGARPLAMAERLDRVASWISDGRLEAAEALLAEIRADLGADDPTVVGLDWELVFARGHGTDPAEP